MASMTIGPPASIGSACPKHLFAPSFLHQGQKTELELEKV